MKHTLKDNLISFCIGCLIAVPVVFCAAGSQARAQEAKPGIYADVDLSDDLQKYIIVESLAHHIAPELVIAMIEQESGCNEAAVGDYGESVGLMQIKQKYHQERMDNLECSNLLDPYDNVAVGIDYLYELFEQYEDPYMVLMEYNGGHAYAVKMMDAGKVSEYALQVLGRARELEGERYGG